MARRLPALRRARIKMPAYDRESEAAFDKPAPFQGRPNGQETAAVQYIAFGILGKANGPFTITARRKIMALRSIRQYKNDDIIPAKGKCAPSESLRLKAKGKPPEAPKDILRTRSEEVARVDDGLRELLEDMVTTMRAANGAGLADRRAEAGCCARKRRRGP